MIERNARYSPWDGTQSMFELDAFDIMDELIDDLVYHGDVMGALRRLLQEGMDGREGNRVMGLQEILERMRRERDRISRSDALGGDFAELAQELRDVVDLERQAIQDQIADAGEAGSDRESELTRDNAQAALLELDFLPEDLAGRVRALQNHQFRSPEAAQRFTDLIERLRAQLLEQTVESISESMQSASPEDIARLAQMLGALNQMIEADRAGEPYDFDGFMNEYGDFFPENPASLEELLEALAQRMAAMSSLLASMSPEQRRQLMELSEQLLADFDLNWQMSQLGHNLRDLFPDEAWDRIRNVEGVDPLQLGQALDSLRDLEDLDDLIRMLSGAPQPGALADVDLDRVRDLVGEEAARSIDQLAQLASRLEREGLVERRDGQL